MANSGYTENIMLYCLFQLQKLSDWNGIRFEVDVSTHAVHALGALLFEMEVIRSYLEPHELPYFDATLAPAQNSSLKAINKLQGKIKTVIKMY